MSAHESRRRDCDSVFYSPVLRFASSPVSRTLPSPPMPVPVRAALVFLAFVALTLVMTWPQALVLQTRAYEHFDVFFNLWRLRWIEHALASSPADLFNGNQFYPERGVLAYSDAILVQGLIAAPLKPVLVHNLILLGGMAGSGAAMFVLAHHFSRSVAASMLAGVVFAFAPYRIAHMMHMEMQWAVWMPLAFWALQRTLDTGFTRFGLLTGLFVFLQLLSCVYYTFFLALALIVVGGVQLLWTPGGRWMRTVAALALGAVCAGVLALPYAAQYRRASSHVGTRSLEEVARYSAWPISYVSMSESNYLYRNVRHGGEEKALFPG